MLQRFVSGKVSEGIVHQLETVQVQHQHREGVVVALVELHVAVEFLLHVPAVVQTGERVGVCQAVELGAGMLMVSLRGAGHDPVKSYAQDAGKREYVLVLLAQTLVQALPDGLLEGVETVDERADPGGVVAMEESQRRRLSEVQASGAELIQGVLVGKAVRQALDELDRRADGLLRGKLLKSLDVLDLTDETAQPRLGDAELVVFEDPLGLVQHYAPPGWLQRLRLTYFLRHGRTSALI